MPYLTHLQTILLIIPYFSSTCAFPLLPRAKDDDEQHEDGLYDQFKDTSQDWCTANPGSCKAVVSVAAVVGLILLCYAIHRIRKWLKRRSSKERVAQLEVERPKIDELAKKEFQNETLKNSVAAALGMELAPKKEDKK